MNPSSSVVEQLAQNELAESIPTNEFLGNKETLETSSTTRRVFLKYVVFSTAAASLAACEGALLIVDATQGIQAQTISNLYLALENDLEIIPVLNKVDLPSANPEEVTDDIVDLLGCKPEEVIPASAKTGLGVEDVLEAVVQRIPAPEGDDQRPLQALIVDSWFDNYVGVVSLVRIVNGSLRKRDKLTVMSTGLSYNADRVGVFTPKMSDRDELRSGEVGFVIAGIKDIYGAPVGDTLTATRKPCEAPLPGFKQIQPRVFAGLFPVSADDYGRLVGALYSEGYYGGTVDAVISRLIDIVLSFPQLMLILVLVTGDHGMVHVDAAHVREHHAHDGHGGEAGLVLE